MQCNSGAFPRTGIFLGGCHGAADQLCHQPHPVHHVHPRVLPLVEVLSGEQSPMLPWTECTRWTGNAPYPWSCLIPGTVTELGRDQTQMDKIEQFF